MTKEQIAALIAAKIAGQGSMVDIGGALPEILTALAENGISTDMTVAEQMQARKDLGLYYEETTTGEKEIAANGDVESKLSDDTPAKEDILKVFNGDNELDFTLVDIEGGYLVNAQTISVFRVMEGDGIYTGSIWATSVYKLIYNGQTTVVSKVPDKYLPIAWNQLVTEGTKIAEVTIGDETTNVFAPEGGGALPWLEIQGDAGSFPNDGDNIDLSAYISQTDWEELRGGKYAGLYQPGKPAVFIQDMYYPLLFSSNGTPAMPVSRKYCVFLRSASYSDTRICHLAFIEGENINNVTVTSLLLNTGTVPGPVELSALPEASMTTQDELDAIGLTDTIIGGIINGNYTGIKFTDTSVLTNIKTAFAQFKTAQRVGGTAADTTLVFDMLGNNYNILVHSVVGNPPTVTVTVTPLT